MDYVLGSTEKLSYGASDFEAVSKILEDYSIPDDVIEEIVKEMWRRGD